MRKTPMPPRKAPMKRGKPPKRTGPLAAMSPKKRAKARRRREVVAEVFDRDGHTCQAAGLAVLPWQRMVLRRARRVGRQSIVTGLVNLPATCGGPLDPHEIIPRSAWADGDLEASNVISVCRSHHDWIDLYPEAAALFGLHGYSWQRMGESAVDDTARRLQAVLEGTLDVPVFLYGEEDDGDPVA